MGRITPPSDPPPSAFANVQQVDSCTVVLPPEGQLRARRIISRSRTIPTGKYPSVKLDRWTHWESPVECDGQRLVDVCPAVLSFGEQPLTILFEAGSQPHKHVPDMILRRADSRPALIEFKSDEDEKLEEARDRAALLTPCLRDQGYDYHLILGSALSRDAYLENATLLRKHAGKPLPLEHYERARAAFESTGALTKHDLLAALKSSHIGLWAISRLFLAGRIAFPMKEAMCPERVLRWVPSNVKPGGIEWLQAAFNVTL